MELLQTMDLWGVQIPIPVALAAVATIGYLVGRRAGGGRDKRAARSRGELPRAQAVARELEEIARTIRETLARHHASLKRLREQVGELSGPQQEAAWGRLCREAEEMLGPTQRLASQIAGACDPVREQGNPLMALTGASTDLVTGVRDRGGLDDALAAQFALLNRHPFAFSVAIFGIDHFQGAPDEGGHREGDQLLQRLARLLNDSARETDAVARYGGEEFAVLMPHTGLEEGSMFAERLRAACREKLPFTVSGGITTVLDGDGPESLLARAGAALGAAKSAGGNCVFRHDGGQIESIWEEAAAGPS